jgi:hypothetical protein
MNFEKKYLKYKEKYISLKKLAEKSNNLYSLRQIGGLTIDECKTLSDTNLKIKGSNLLANAIESNNLEVINCLLEKGVKFVYNIKYGTEPDYIDESNRNLETYKKIIEMLATNKDYFHILKVVKGLKDSTKFKKNLNDVIDTICDQNLDGLKDELNELIYIAFEFNLVDKIQKLLDKGIEFIYDPKYGRDFIIDESNRNLETYKKIIEMLATNKDYNNILKVVIGLKDSTKFKANLNDVIDIVCDQNLDGLKDELKELIYIAIDFNLVDKIQKLLDKGVKFIYKSEYLVNIYAIETNIKPETYKKILEMLITNKDYENLLKIVYALVIRFKLKSKQYLDILITNITKDELDKYSDSNKEIILSNLLFWTTEFYFVEAAEWLSNNGAIYSTNNEQILSIQQKILNKAELDKSKLLEDKEKYLLKLKCLSKQKEYSIYIYVIFLSILYERDSKEFLDLFCNFLKTINIEDYKNIFDNLYIILNIANLYNFKDNADCINLVLKKDVKVINDINLINREININIISNYYNKDIFSGIDFMTKIVNISKDDDNIEYLELIYKNINSDILRINNIDRSSLNKIKLLINELFQKYENMRKDSKILILIENIYSKIITNSEIKNVQKPVNNSEISINTKEIKSSDILKDLQKCSNDNNMLYKDKMKHIDCYSKKESYKFTTKINYDISSNEVSNVEQLNEKFKKCTKDNQNLRKEREENLDCYLYNNKPKRWFHL